MKKKLSNAKPPENVASEGLICYHPKADFFLRCPLYNVKWCRNECSFNTPMTNIEITTPDITPK